MELNLNFPNLSNGFKKMRFPFAFHVDIHLNKIGWQKGNGSMSLKLF